MGGCAAFLFLPSSPSFFLSLLDEFTGGLAKSTGYSTVNRHVYAMKARTKTKSTGNPSLYFDLLIKFVLIFFDTFDVWYDGSQVKSYS